MKENRGIIMFNKGTKCLVRAIVCLESLRKHWDGPITMYLEDTPEEFHDVCKHYNVDIVKNDINNDRQVLVRKTEMMTNPPYDRTLWLDSDTVVMGSIDGMFDLLDHNDVVIPSFCDWYSNGRIYSKRIKRFENIAEKRHYKKALEENAAINTGILSFKKSGNWTKFVKDWVALADKGSEKRIFISDEVSFQILYPSIEEWGLSIVIADKKYNVSVKYGKDIKDKRILHAHGQKHCLDFELCSIWKDLFEDMKKSNTCMIKDYLKYADKRLRKYLNPPASGSDVTIVTACDEKYIDILRETFPNWVEYKKIDSHPVIIFVNGIPLDDERLDFLKKDYITLIEWSEKDLDNVTDHRELMLSAFVSGTAQYVQTDYWLKLDADSYATDFKPLYSDDMKKFDYCGHKWGYSRPDHIKALDKWAKGHWRGKLKKASPMIEDGRIENKRFYHNKKRTISFIQLHKTKFTKFCVKLCRERRLPAPTQDTFMFFVCDRFDPHLAGHANFKKNHGFTQGNGRRGVDAIREKLKEVDEKNNIVKKETEYNQSSEDLENDYFDPKCIINDSFLNSSSSSSEDIREDVVVDEYIIEIREV